MFKEATFGDSALSTAMSLKDKWMLGSYMFSFWTVISLGEECSERGCPKHHRAVWLFHTFLKINGVMNNWACGIFPDFPYSTFKPCAHSNWVHLWIYSGQQINWASIADHDSVTMVVVHGQLTFLFKKLLYNFLFNFLRSVYWFFYLFFL